MFQRAASESDPIFRTPNRLYDRNLVARNDNAPPFIDCLSGRQQPLQYSKRHPGAAPLMIRHIAFLLLLSLAFPIPALELQASPDHSTSGTFNLSWQGQEGESYRLFQQNHGGASRLIYQGTDTARVMTGLPNGSYNYRVEGESGSSQPRSVNVDQHSLLRAFSFFGVGLLVFVATVLLVVRGAKEP